MDLTRLTQGEKIAGVSGIALVLIMFIFKWFGLEAGAEGFAGTVEGGTENAFGAYGFFDLVLFITALAAIGLALVRASQTSMNLPVALSAVVAGLGVLSVILVIISIINPPSWDVGGVSVDDFPGVDVTRKIGVWLGLIAAAGVAYGGWRAMQEEGTTFGAEADRLQDRVGRGGEEPPPPRGDEPPSPPPPPPTGTPPPPST
jgi:hypothetical protein